MSNMMSKIMSITVMFLKYLYNFAITVLKPISKVMAIMAS
jgi:hypothetical protein